MLRRGRLDAPSARRDAGVVEVPLLGRVAAGVPILAEENVEDVVRLDSYFLGGGRKVFALKVAGDSMIGDGILDGDTLFVRQQETANRGDVVVFLIEGEATVKRYYPEGDRIRLLALEPQHGRHLPAQERLQARPDREKGEGIAGEASIGRWARPPSLRFDADRRLSAPAGPPAPP